MFGFLFWLLVACILLVSLTNLIIYCYRKNPFSWLMTVWRLKQQDF